MSLRVLAPAPSFALISLAEVKERLSLATDESDAALRLVIGDASAAIVAELGFDLAYQRYSETATIQAGSAAILSRWPIEAASIETATPAGAPVTGWSLDGASILRRLGSSCGGGGRLVVTYAAGYLLPDRVATWSASAPANAGGWFRPTTPSPLRFVVTTAGTLGEAEPAWPTEAGATIESGDATLSAHEVPELPDALRTLAWRETFTRWSARDRDPGLVVTSSEQEGDRETYAAPSAPSALEPGVLAGLDSWRYPR